MSHIVLSHKISLEAIGLLDISWLFLRSSSDYMCVELKLEDFFDFELNMECISQTFDIRDLRLSGAFEESISI